MMGPKTYEWMGMGIQAAMVAMKGANVTLRLMLTKTASHLDVAESALSVKFGRFDKEWGWRAALDKGGVIHMGSTQADPMQALGALVAEVER